MSLALQTTHSLWTRWFLRSCPTLWCQSLVGFPTASVEDDDCNPASDAAGRPLHRDTVLNDTVQLTADTADVDEGSMPSVLYMRSSDSASFCTAVDVVDAVDGDEVTMAVAVAEVVGLADAFLSGEHTGQSGRTQFFQCQMICRRIAQCWTAGKYTGAMLVVYQLKELNYYMWSAKVNQLWITKNEGEPAGG